MNNKEACFFKTVLKLINEYSTKEANCISQIARELNFFLTMLSN